MSEPISSSSAAPHAVPAGEPRAPRRAAPARAGALVLEAVPLLVVGVLLVDATEPVLPTSTLIWKITVARLLFVVGFAALIASGARLRDFRTRLDVPIALALLAVAISVVYAGVDASPLEALASDLLLYYLTVGLVRRNPDAIRGLAVVALATIVITGVVALDQIAEHAHTGFCRTFLTDVSCSPGMLNRATGTFANPNALAPDILLLAPLAAIVAYTSADRWSRLVFGALALAGFGGMVVAFSRGAYVGVVVAAFVVGLVLLHRRGLWRRAYSWALLVGGVLAAAAFLSGMVGAIGRRNKIWSRALTIASHHLLTGVGYGRSRQVLGLMFGVPVYHAHDLWLTWLLDTGVLGFVGMIVLTIVSLRHTTRLALAGSPTALALLAALTAFYVVSLVDDPAWLNPLALTWWFVLGAAMGERLRRSARGRRRSAGPFARLRPLFAEPNGSAATGRDPTSVAGVRYPAAWAPPRSASETSAPWQTVGYPTNGGRSGPRHVRQDGKNGRRAVPGRPTPTPTRRPTPTRTSTRTRTPPGDPA